MTYNNDNDEDTLNDGLDDDWSSEDCYPRPKGSYPSPYSYPYGCYPPGFRYPTNKEPEITTELFNALLVAHQREIDTLKESHERERKFRDEARIREIEIMRHFQERK